MSGRRQKKTASRSVKGATDETRHQAVENPDSLAKAIQEELNVAPEKAERLEKSITIVAQRSFSGPLPPPHLLAAYDEISPGLQLERIVGMAERQAGASPRPGARCCGGEYLDGAGVIGGVVLGLSALAVIALAILYEAPLQYLGGIVLAVAALVVNHVYARKKKTEDAERRIEAMNRAVPRSRRSRSRGGDLEVCLEVTKLTDLWVVAATPGSTTPRTAVQQFPATPRSPMSSRRRSARTSA